MPSFPFDGYVYLTIAALCSIGIGAMFKVAAIREIDQTYLIFVNYVVATVAGVLIAGSRIASLITQPELLGLSIGTGVLFILGFYAMGRATKIAGVALTLSSWRMSVVIPFIASWIIWGEDPSGFQLLGLLVAIAGFFLISNPMGSKSGSRQSVWLLFFVFAIGGIVDTLFKTMTENFASADDILSVSCLIFGAATISMIVPIAIRTSRQTEKSDFSTAVIPGVVLGLINLGSIVFLLAALDSIPGTVVFPVNNISVVAGAAILGTVVWDEGLTRSAKLGVALAVISLILLTAGW